MPVSRVRTIATAVTGSPYYTNMYFDNPTGAISASSFIGKVSAFWTTLQGQIANGLLIAVQAEVPLVDETNGKMIGSSAGTQANITANGTGDVLPLQDQALIQWYTNGFVNGRRVRGRTFIPGMLEVNNVSAKPGQGLKDIMSTAALALMTGSFPIGVWARPLTKPGATPDDERVVVREGSFHAIQSYAIWNLWATMRSRRD